MPRADTIFNITNTDTSIMSWAPEQFRLTSCKHYIQLDCKVNYQLRKQDMVNFLRQTRPILEEYGKNQLLVIASNEWNVDIETWGLLTKLKFKNTSFKIAVVSVSIHQNLLLKKLGQLNNNIKAFPDKRKALEWLRT